MQLHQRRGTNIGAKASAPGGLNPTLRTTQQEPIHERQNSKPSPETGVGTNSTGATVLFASSVGSAGEEEAECSRHPGKRIEAYCVRDKTTICIDCILAEEHKNHEIVSLSKGAEKERESLFGAGAKISALGEALGAA